MILPIHLIYKNNSFIGPKLLVGIFLPPVLKTFSLIIFLILSISGLIVRILINLAHILCVFLTKISPISPMFFITPSMHAKTYPSAFLYKLLLIAKRKIWNFVISVALTPILNLAFTNVISPILNILLKIAGYLIIKQCTFILLVLLAPWPPPWL